MNIVKTKMLAVYLLFLGSLIPANAQEILEKDIFTLEEALLLASENNREVRKALADVDAARAGNQQGLAAFLPAVELSTGYTASNDPLYAFGFKLQQQSVTMADFDPNVINNPGNVNHFNTQVLVEQPLVNLDAWIGKSALSKQVKATELKSEYTKEHISYMIKQTYYALQLAKSRIDVINRAQSATSSYLKMAEDNLAQGYLKEADVLSVKVRTYEQDANLLEAENQLKTVTEMLNFLMGRPSHSLITVSDSIMQVTFTIDGLSTVNKRSDVLAMQYGMEAYKDRSKSDLMKFAPRINAFGAYNMYDSNFGGFNYDSYMVGVKLQWRIFNGGKNIGSYKQSKANYTKAMINYEGYVERGNMELDQAKRSITLAQSQLITYNMAAQESIESLRIRSDRYNEGLERTADLLMAETTAEESLLKKLNAIYNYNLAVFKYQLLTSEAQQN